ncbi:homeobox protein MOX-2-like isoform X2 [Eriocheir sinensis]|uniref:homeobox protein MOX-2-like isoform X2 n=1 Tax=Eriocheir sinensis TaxID=95602 RepID=UPI0021C813BA|nr:homeobox protein MOX-2-like isoform X2 [Eriocheir sinensis]
MASGNSSGLGSSIFRGTLHGNSSNLGGNNSSNTSSNSNSSSHHQHHHHHHHHHHHTTSHHLPQTGVPAAPPPQPAIGPMSISSEESPRGRGTPRSPDHMSTVMAKLWFDHNVEYSLSSLKKEEHEKRTRDLRKQLEYISDTNWKYSPVEKYIGQQ